MRRRKKYLKKRIKKGIEFFIVSVRIKKRVSKKRREEMTTGRKWQSNKEWERTLPPTLFSHRLLLLTFLYSYGPDFFFFSLRFPLYSNRGCFSFASSSSSSPSYHGNLTTWRRVTEWCAARLNLLSHRRPFGGDSWWLAFSLFQSCSYSPRLPLIEQRQHTHTTHNKRGNDDVVEKGRIDRTREPKQVALSTSFLNASILYPPLLIHPPFPIMSKSPFPLSQ